MLEWITGIAGVVLGTGSTSLYQFFTNRSDKRKDATRKELGVIIQKLSSFGTSLHIALNEWNDNLYHLGELLDAYIDNLQIFSSKLQEIGAEGDMLMVKHKECFCELAPNCHHRVDGPLPKDFDNLLEKEESAKVEFDLNKVEFENECLRILDNVIKSLDKYSDFLNHIPEAYTLPSKIFNRIYPFLFNIEKANQEILSRVRAIKATPEFIGDKSNRLGKPINVTIELIELAKIEIVKSLEKL